MEDLRPWFELKSVPGVGNVLFRRLLEAFGSPAAALAASRADLEEVDGVSPRLAGIIRAHRAPDSAFPDLQELSAQGRRVVVYGGERYPVLLRHIHDPPPILYEYGELDGEAPCAGVVGSRAPTHYGLRTARRLAEGLAEAGVTVVSGMAAGIDTAAHEGAIKAGGRTVAVAGCGLDRVYPPSNRRLFEEIAQSGAVISEFAPGTAPVASNFPARNRIISGMSMAVVVVEAASRSGSLITARLAGEQGRDVFAVPGSVASRKSAGTNRLIKQGAGLVESAADVLEQLSPSWDFKRTGGMTPSAGTAKAPPVELGPGEAELYAELSPYPLHIDVLAARLNMEAGKIASLLLQLELKGLAVQTPGKYFTRGE